jgi:hypothetical protein
MRNLGGIFREITVVDFEFQQPDGERPRPICMVAHELVSGRVHRLFGDELRRLPGAPYPVDRGAVVVTYYGSAEAGCHLALGWPTPAWHLDLYPEFRLQTNGIDLPNGRGLLGALNYYGLDSMEVAFKEAMRQLAIRGEPYSADESEALLRYCESDVDGLARLLRAMDAALDIDRALLRGRYMTAAAHIERNGVPIDTEMLTTLRTSWDDIKGDLIAAVDQDYGIYVDGSFKAERFAEWLAKKEIPWPLTEQGRLALDDQTFKDAANAYPAVAPLRELRHALSQLRLEDLAVGRDGRNRVMLSAFASKTARNAPSNTRFIFGPSVWTRSLIKPPPGRAIAYIDWSMQEFGAAAALSGDERMMAAYRSGDPYLAFAKMVGAVPADATKSSHKRERELYKQTVLATGYGMGAVSLAAKLGISPALAKTLLDKHRSAFPTYWEWSDAALNHGLLLGYIFTVFGWKVNVGPDVNPRSLRNFPVQGNGAEMLRLACIFAVERGVTVLAPVHDALLIEAPIADIEEMVARTQKAMEDASAAVLSGFRLRTDVKVFAAPDRYSDERGTAMWNHVMALLKTKGRIP